MSLKIKWVISFLLILGCVQAQKISGVYKIDALLNRINNNSDTIYVVNFWATWCKPCVQELPAFIEFAEKHKDEKIKVLLVTLDFKEELNKKVNPFLVKNKITTECVLLDEVNGNDFIDKIYKGWTGAIPATLFTFSNKQKLLFLEKKLNLEQLEEHLLKVKQ